MHFTKLADARSSKAYSALAYETRLFKWLFSFCNAGTSSNIRMFLFFLEKGGSFNRQKDFKQEHCFVENFNVSDSKGSKKRKGMFSTYELFFKSAFESLLSFVLL